MSKNEGGLGLGGKAVQGMEQVTDYSTALANSQEKGCSLGELIWVINKTSTDFAVCKILIFIKSYANIVLEGSTENAKAVLDAAGSCTKVQGLTYDLLRVKRPKVGSCLCWDPIAAPKFNMIFWQIMHGGLPV